MNAIHYRPEIDGLRAVAVLSVIFFHAHLGVPGGYTGVDIFFVISGFLITSFIKKDLDAGTFSFADFWERRIRRILPASMTMIALSLIVGYTLFLPKELSDLSSSILAQMGFSANLYFWRDFGYFSGPSEIKPLLHTWSLAVEEQFYLLFPIFLVIGHHFMRNYLKHAVLIALLVSFCLCVFGSYKYPSATFYLLPTRAWELLVGAVLAFSSLANISRRSAELLSLFGATLIAWGLFGLDRESRFPGFNACFPVVGAAAIIASNSDTLSVVGRCLAHPWCVFVGKISYSLYLWHWPLFAFSHYILDARPSRGISGVLIGITFLFAILSYYLIEQPFRYKKTFSSRPFAYGFAVSSCAVFLCMAGLVRWDNGVPSRVPAAFRSEYPHHITAPRLERIETGDFPIIGAIGHQPEFIVWGDSHAGVAVPFFDELGKSFGIAGINAAHGGNPPIPGCRIYWNPKLEHWNDLILKEIEKRGIKHIFLIARWASYIEGATDYDIQQGLFRDLPVIFTDEGSKSPEDAVKVMNEGFYRLFENLSSQGCRIYLVMQGPEQSFDPFRRRFLSHRLNIDLSRSTNTTSKKDYLRRQARFLSCLDAARRTYNIRVIDRTDMLFSPTGQSLIEEQGVYFYTDHQHFSLDAVRILLEDSLNDVFRDIVISKSNTRVTNQSN